MARVRRPASARGERDASARSLDAVGLAARKEGWTASPSPALPCPSAHASPGSRGVGEGPRRVQCTPSSAHRGLADEGATVAPTREQPALFPTGSLVLLGLLTVQLLRTLDTKLR